MAGGKGAPTLQKFAAAHPKSTITSTSDIMWQNIQPYKARLPGERVEAATWVLGSACTS